ncbi:hypothetical protein QYF36_021329 [Acer negundo]|nr:hypothetical protein QYF36_021329 [Acer negundo]
MPSALKEFQFCFLAFCVQVYVSVFGLKSLACISLFKILIVFSSNNSGFFFSLSRNKEEKYQISLWAMNFDGDL